MLITTEYACGVLQGLNTLIFKHFNFLCECFYPFLKRSIFLAPSCWATYCNNYKCHETVSDICLVCHAFINIIESFVNILFQAFKFYVDVFSSSFSDSLTVSLTISLIFSRSVGVSSLCAVDTMTEKNNIRIVMYFIFYFFMCFRYIPIS